ncbi:MAG: hypothetical protein IT559_02515 [Alphaproteobacteria bacterium]|nr:hypothetical protein [Alphaproteobacteria bacterium]
MVNQKQACLSGHDLVLAAVQKVIVDHESITVQINVSALSAFITEQLKISMPQAADETREIKIPYITRRAHRGSIIIEKDKNRGERDYLDLPPSDLRNLVRGLIWRDEHFGGMTLRDIAKREEFSEGYVGQCIFNSLNAL